MISATLTGCSILCCIQKTSNYCQVFLKFQFVSAEVLEREICPRSPKKKQRLDTWPVQEQFSGIFHGSVAARNVEKHSSLINMQYPVLGLLWRRRTGSLYSLNCFTHHAPSSCHCFITQGDCRFQNSDFSAQEDEPRISQWSESAVSPCSYLSDKTWCIKFGQGADVPTRAVFHSATGFRVAFFLTVLKLYMVASIRGAKRVSGRRH